jgi:hypothetical protein
MVTTSIGATGDEVQEFKPIAGFESRYLIGSLGDVVSVVYGREKKRNVTTGRDGYVRVVLTDGKGGMFTRYVHRLVSEAFIPNPEGLSDVNHKDMDKRNNCVQNLEWVSHRDNLMKAIAIKGDWRAEAASRKLSKAVVAQDVQSGEEWEFASARAWAVSNGNANMAANICRAIQTGRSAYGYYWRFKGADEALPRNTNSMPVHRDARMLMVANSRRSVLPILPPGVKLGSELEARS